MAAEISFVLTEQDYAEAARGQYLHRVRSPKQWIWALGALAVIFGLFAYAESCDLKSFLFNAAPYVALTIVIVPLVTALTYWWAGRVARRMFRQQAIRPESRVSWNDEGLGIESDVGSLNAKWSDFYGWRKAGRTYMIHMNEALYYVVPGHAVSPEQAADLESTLARSGLVKR